MISLIKQESLDNAKLIVPIVSDYMAKNNLVISHFNKGFTTKTEFEAARKALRIERMHEEEKILGRWANRRESDAARAIISGHYTD